MKSTAHTRVRNRPYPLSNLQSHVSLGQLRQRMTLRHLEIQLRLKGNPEESDTLLLLRLRMLRCFSEFSFF